MKENKDKLKQFIRQNRDAFEEEGPDPGLWERISEDVPLREKSPVLWWTKAWRIAAVFVLGALSWALIRYIGAKDENAGKLSGLQGLRMTYTEARPVNTDPSDDHVGSDENHFLADHGQRNDRNPQVQQDVTLPEEFREIQTYYMVEIHSARQEVFRLASDRPDIRRQVDLEFSKIDSIYSELKRDLKDNMENTEVIEAMILNYKVKLEILEMMLEQLKESKAETEKPKVYEI